MFSEFKIQHTTTLPYNPSSNPVECFHRTLTAMLQTQGPGVQENRDLWLNAPVLAYNSTVSSSTGVTPHYAMFGYEVKLLVNWVFLTPSVRRNTQIYKPLTQNIQVKCLVWYFDPRIITGTSHKLRSFWAGPYRVVKIIAPALAEIKSVYYLGE